MLSEVVWVLKSRRLLLRSSHERCCGGCVQELRGSFPHDGSIWTEQPAPWQLQTYQNNAHIELLCFSVLALGPSALHVADVSLLQRTWFRLNGSTSDLMTWWSTELRMAVIDFYSLMWLFKSQPCTNWKKKNSMHNGKMIGRNVAYIWSAVNWLI